MNLNKPDYAGKSASELIEIFEAQMATLKQSKASMKVKDLIETLIHLPPHCHIYVWLDDGTRLPVTQVDADPAFVADGFIDLMVYEEPATKKED
jgi:hypothetical protein